MVSFYNQYTGSYLKLSQVKRNALFVFIFFFLTISINAVNVNPDGSLSYQIPIKIPPGTGGIQPNISLMYNSNGSNGVLGVGWQLSGLPVITRDHGYPRNYDSNDRFRGQGGRMINMGNGSYHYEKENFSEIVPVIGGCAAIDQVCGWVETLQNGTKMYYGISKDKSSVNALYLTQDQRGAYLWALNEVEDVYGRGYVVEYDRPGDGQMYPKQIFYTTHSSLSSYRRILFQYENRTDLTTGYSTESPITTTQRLSEILVEHNVNCYLFNVLCLGEQVRRYALTYEYSASSQRSRLKSIQQFGSDDITSLPPQTFNWTNSDHTFTASIWSGAGNWPNPMVGDFNGDGKSDFMQFQTDLGWRVLLSTGSSFTASIWSGAGNWPSSMVGDFNGDGKSDFMQFVTGQGWRVLLSTGSSFTASIWSGAGNWPSPMVGDFNGDGKSDFMQFQTGVGWRVLLSTGSSFTASIWSGAGNWPSPMVGDFNGDGKSDFMQFQTGLGWRVLLSTGSSFTASIWSGAGNWPTPMVGDFNGDGKSDFMQFQTDLGWRVLLSTGSSFTASIWSGAGNWPSPMVGDFNGDGKSDFMQFQTDLGWRVLLSKGDKPDILNTITNGIGGFTQIEYLPATQVPGAIVLSTNTAPVLANKSPRYLVTKIVNHSGVDTNEDGALDIFSNSYEYYNGKVATGYINERKDLGFEWVKTVDDATGNYSITYYRQGQNSDFRLAGTPLKTESYAGGIKVSESFRNFEVYPPGPPGTSLTYVVRPKESTDFSPNAVTFSGRTITYDLSGIELSRKTQHVLYDDGTVDLFRAGVPLQKAEAVGQEVVITSYIYDTNNPTTNASFARAVEEKKYHSSVHPFNLLSHTKYNYTGIYLDSIEECLKSTPADVCSFIKTQYTYDLLGLGNITRIEYAFGSPEAAITQYIHDAKYHTFVETLTQGYGKTYAQSVTRTYDYGAGHILTETDPNGHSIAMEYDALNRLVKTYDQDNNLAKEIIYPDYDSVTGQFVEERIYNSSVAGGFAWTRQYFDGMGRLYKNEKSAYPDHVFITQKGYNDQNKIQWETNAYLANQLSKISVNGVYKTEYIYDLLGRVIQTNYPEGVSSTTLYSGSTVHITDPKGNTLTTVYNMRGQEILILEPLVQGEASRAQASFSYDIAGRLIEAIDTSGNATRITYDSLGRKTSMTEPGSGLWLYAYDKIGNLKTQIDPKGQTITFAYDVLGRLLSKSYSSGEPDVIFEYDAGVNGKGRLSSIKDNIGLTTYSYDKRGNKIQWTKTIQDVNNPGGSPRYSLVFRAQYDSLNRMQKLFYPDNTHVHNYYSDYGYIREVRFLKVGQSFGTTFVKYKGLESGLVDEIQRVTNNGVTTHIGFDWATLRATSIRTTAKDGITDLQNVAYHYDSAGNITEVTDLLDSTQSQTFTYDERYRLTQATGQYGAIHYQYSQDGNLTQKGDLLLYYGNDSACGTYNSSPHAVCADSQGNFYDYDANGNMTTRRGRELFYDSENKLASIAQAGTTKVSFEYDQSGYRVIKQNHVDGTISYSIDGLYEILEKPDGTKLHTKYVYGVEGDLAGQITEDSVNVTLTAYASATNFTYLASLPFGDRSSGLEVWALLFSIKEKAEAQFSQKQTDIVIYLFVLFLFGLSLFYIKSNFIFKKNRAGIFKIHFTAERKFISPVALKTLYIFIFTFAMPHCFGEEPAGQDPAIWPGVITIPADIPSIGDLNGTETYNDLFTGGQPLVGVYFFHPDSAVSTALVTDQDGKVVSEIHYKPYGEIDRTASPAGKDYDIVKFKFTAQVEDPETSLYYYGARYYDPALGRFISADIKLDTGAGIAGLNRYMYVGGNPVLYSDPGGHELVTLLITVVVGALVGGTASYVSYGQQTGNWNSAEAWAAFGIGAAAGAVGALVGFGAGALVSSTLGGGTLGTIAGSSVGGLMGGASGGYVAYGLHTGDWVSNDAWEVTWRSGIAGLAGGFVGGAAVVSGIPIISGYAGSTALGGSTSGAVGAALNGGDIGQGALTGFIAGFISGWATGIFNREFNTDGVISYDKEGNLLHLQNGDVVMLTSNKGEFVDWLWSTMVGGYSHVTSVEDGKISQYGSSWKGKFYEGRSYKVIARGQVIDVPKTNLVGARFPGDMGTYNYMTNNCTTSMSAGLSIPSQWAPYNIYTNYNFPQFGYWWH